MGLVPITNLAIPSFLVYAVALLLHMRVRWLVSRSAAGGVSSFICAADAQGRGGVRRRARLSLPHPAYNK